MTLFLDCPTRTFPILKNWVICISSGKVQSHWVPPNWGPWSLCCVYWESIRSKEIHSGWDWIWGGRLPVKKCWEQTLFAVVNKAQCVKLSQHVDKSCVYKKDEKWQTTTILSTFNTFPEQVLILTIAESRLEPLNLPRLDGHDQDEPNTAGEQRGQQEVGDGPERDHSRHLGQSWMRNTGRILRTGI